MSFVDAIIERARERGTRPVLYEVQGSELVPTSGEALLDGVAAVRGYLRARGVKAGDRVALLAPNGWRWAACDIAILGEGAIAVPLYARQAPTELAGILRDCTPTLLIAADEALAEAIGAAWGERDRIARYDDAFAGDAIREPAASLADDATVTLVYTSGTSGEPKGVMLTAGGVEYMLGVTVVRLAEMSGAGRSEDRVFHYLPLCFAGSRVMLWSQLRRGNPMMLSTDLTNLAEEIKTAAPHYMLNVPAVLERIKNGVEQKIAERGGPIAALFAAAARAATGAGKGMRDALALKVARAVLFPRIKQMIGPNLEFLACGSAALGEATQRWFEMLGIPVYQVYGLTETTAIVTIDDVHNVVPGRVGLAIPGCEVRVSDEGELICRGPNTFAGYWNRPDLTAKVIRDGWLHTGDQAEIDANGNVKVLGRLGDVLVLESGHNVAPAPIEEKLCAASANVEQAVVFGHARPNLIAVVTGPPNGVDLDALRDAVNAELPHYKRLRQVWRAPEAFSPENGLLTANQKLKRAAIEAHYRDAIEGLYA
jgi:long-chain acyl-CoA synthetase